jgi:hypothetical protein
MAEIVSSATHWYAKDGAPMYTMVGKNGKERAPTLRDARTLGLLPGCTEIIKQAAKPGLERWMVQQGILAALTLPRLDGESSDAFLQRVEEDRKAQAKAAAERGVAIHAALERSYAGRNDIEAEYVPHVISSRAVLEDAFASRRWAAEKSFASALGYGCKIDLCTFSDQGIVTDFKTKEFQSKDEKQLAWDEHAMQLAANRVAAGIPNATCANLFVSTTVPGLVHLHVWPEEDLARGWSMFKALLSYWYAKTGLGIA